jgi:hypothetical protein
MKRVPIYWVMVFRSNTLTSVNSHL